MKKYPVLLFLTLYRSLVYSGDNTLLFDTEDDDSIVTSVPVLSAWKQVVLDTNYGGNWIVTGDVDGDGISDVTLLTTDPGIVHIFKNEHGKTTSQTGCGVNFTFY